MNRLDHGGGADVQVILTGRLSRAEPGVRTPRIHVTKVVLNIGREFVNDGAINAEELARGITITLGGPVC